jgi:hypothetical protein
MEVKTNSQKILTILKTVSDLKVNKKDTRMLMIIVYTVDNDE